MQETDPRTQQQNAIQAAEARIAKISQELNAAWEELRSIPGRFTADVITPPKQLTLRKRVWLQQQFDAPTPEEICVYLLGTGWSPTPTNGKTWAKFTKYIRNDEWHMEVPLAYEAKDWSRTVRIFLEDLSLALECNSIEVLRAIFDFKPPSPSTPA